MPPALQYLYDRPDLQLAIGLTVLIVLACGVLFSYGGSRAKPGITDTEKTMDRVYRILSVLLKEPGFEHLGITRTPFGEYAEVIAIRSKAGVPIIQIWDVSEHSILSVQLGADGPIDQHEHAVVVGLIDAAVKYLNEEHRTNTTV